MDAELSEKMRLKKFRDEAKNICHKDNNVSNISLMATYAEKVCFLDVFIHISIEKAVSLSQNQIH